MMKAFLVLGLVAAVLLVGCVGGGSPQGGEKTSGKPADYGVSPSPVQAPATASAIESEASSLGSESSDVAGEISETDVGVLEISDEDLAA